MNLLLLALLAGAPGEDPARAAAYDALAQHPRRTPVVEVASVVGPSVVYIETESVGTVESWPFSRKVRQQGGGTGVVVHEEGFVVTNFHVVRGAQRITVSFAGDPVSYLAELLSYKQNEDLALLRILDEGLLDTGELREGLPAGMRSGSVRRTETPDLFHVEVERRPFPAVRMGTSADLMIGETVVAIGNPHGQEHTVSDGIVSGLHRDVQAQDLRFSNLIQTDASINLGNSGGPLLNIHGELIGINTVMNTAAENIGFAIPVDRVREVLEEELIPNARRRAWLGLDLDPMDPGLVTAVVPGGPAEAAGLCVGHRIERLGERRVDTAEDWTLASLQLMPGELTLAEVAGPDGPLELKLIPWTKVDGILWRHLGLRIQVLKTRRSGDLVRVISVQPEGPAAATGMEIGDLLPAVRPATMGGRPSAKIRSGRDLAAIVERMAPDEELEVEVIRVRPEAPGELDRYVGTIVVSGG